LVGFEQDAGVGELAGGGGAGRYEPLQLISFSVIQDYWVFLLHNGSSDTHYVSERIRSSVTEY
jgi:hypothetical protein